MAGDRPARLDGALPLAALLALGLVVTPLHDALYAVAALYLTFAAAMASGGADRPGEPQLAWSLYALGAGFLAVFVPLGGFVDALRTAVYGPLVLMGIGFAAHTFIKAHHGGVVRIGLLSAFGRRRHDARIGRTLEATALMLVAAVLLSEPALYAVAGWLLTVAAVAERPDSEPEPAPRRMAQAPAVSNVT